MAKKKKKKVDAPLSEKEKRKQKIQEYNDKIAKMNGEKTSKEKAKEQKEKNIFSAFDDGYNFGDITKTASKFVEKEIVDKAYDMADSWKKDKNKTSEKLKYLKQGADLSAINTATNIADAPLQNIQEGAQKSKNKSGIRNFVEPIIKNLDVAGVTNIPEMARESAQIWSDPKKSVTDKILGTGLKMLNNNPLTRGLEAAGQSANIFRDADQDFKNIRKGIRKPSEKLTKIHQKEGEKFSQGFRDVDEASQSIVQQIPAATVSILSGNPDLGLAVMGTSVKGGSTYEAEQMGADLGTANEIGLAKELTEVGTEKISSLGSKWYGQGKSDDLLESVIDKKVKNKLGNYLTKKAAGVGGEILEEGISDVVGTAIDKATVDPDAKYTVKDFLHTAKITALSTIGMNAVTGNYSKKAYQKNALDMAESQRSENAQKVFEKELSDRLMEESDNGKNKLKGKDIIKITQEVAEDVANGQIDVSKIESTLGGDTYKQYQDLQNKKSSLLKEQETLRNKSMNEATLGDSERLKQIESEISGLDDTELKERLSNEVRELTKDDNLLAKSYEEKDNRSKEFIYEGTDKDTDITKATIESTKGKLNNTKKAHNLVDALIKMGNDKGVTYKVTNNEELKKMGLVKEGQTTNGVYIGENGEIYVNLDSKNYLEQIIMHETTHVLEKAKAYKDLQNLAFEFAKKNGTYETLEKEIQKNYDNKDWDSELTARIVEDNLGNEDFVTELTHQKPAIVQKIIDTIKYLKKQFTAGSSEARKLNKIQYQLEQAYKKAYNEKSDTNTNKNFSEQKSTSFSLTKDSNGKKLTKEQQEYFKGSKAVDKNGDLKVLYNGGGDYTTFDNTKMSDQSKWGKGIYLTENSEIANMYGDNVKEVYADIKNPINQNEKTISFDKYNKLIQELYDEEADRYEYDMYDNDLDLLWDATNKGNWADYGEQLRNIVGVDGLIIDDDNPAERMMIAFNSNQVKNIDNINPTKSSDIRYSLTEDNQGRELSKQQQEYFKDSKVRDENGKLIPVYHGTTEEINVFEKNRLGKNTGAASAGEGFFFVENKKIAEDYSRYARPQNIKDLENEYKRLELEAQKTGNWDAYYKAYEKYEEAELNYAYNEDNQRSNAENQKEVYLNLTNPLVHDFKGDSYRDETYYDLLKQAKENGNDGAIFKNTYDGYGEPGSWDNPMTNIYVAFESNQIKNVNNTNPTESPDIRYSKTVEEANTGKSDNGVKLTKEQKEYFKNSKATDENGNLITVYHTTTNAIEQFNEFNPVGTDYYRFGDQVVNYYTNSKEMSGSYADQDYVMADTSKISSMDEVNKLIEEHNNNLNPDEKYDYNVEIVKDGDGYKLKVTSQPGASYSGEIEEFYPRKYKNDIDLFKRIKNDLKNYRTIRDENGKALSNNKKIQYEGYVNITNPYIVDAEKRNWNQVVSESNEFIDDLDERVPDDIKNNLTRLYRESENKSAEARENYNVLENIINQGIDGYNSSVDEDVRKVNKIIKKVGYDEIEDLLNYDGQMGIMGVRGWYNLSDALKEQDLIGDSTSKLIIDEFKLPENLKEYIKENYTKEIPLHYIQFNDMDITKAMNQLGKSTTLKDIYNKNQENYNEFDKYRMPNSYFLEELKKEGNDYLGYDLEDMFETRAEVMGADTVADEISQAASVGFSKPELIRLWGTSKTTNDIVKEVIASNKDGKTNYDGVIIRNVYDYGGKSAGEKTFNDLYVTFNSNQFKAEDNKTPTEDADIRYSKGDNIALVKKKGTLGSEVKLENGKVNLDNIAPVKGEVKYSAKEDKNSAKKTIKPSRKARKSYVSEKVEKAIINQAYKNMNVTTKTAQNYLKFTSEQKKEFKNSLIDLTTKMKDELTNAKTYNKVKDIVSNYANVEYNYVDEELKSIKKEIRGTKIKVPDEVKAQITDYSDFRKASRLNINSQGQSIDSVYQELSQEYPYLFSEDVQTEADMLYELSDFMYKDEKTTEKYRIPDNELKRATDKIYNSILNNSLTQAEIEEMQRDLDAKAERRTRQVVQHELLNKMGISIEDIDTGKDVSSAKVQLLDPKRLNEDVFSKEAAQKINDATVNFVNEQEAKNNRWKKKERQEIKDLGIKARSKESAAVQKYGEKEYINDKGELVKYGDAELEREFSNPETREKIKNAAKVLRDKYDNYIDEINNSLTQMGYDPIPKRKDYFRHFYEINDKLSEWGIPFNRDSMNSDTLPTDINGLTDQFKPGKNFFASALQRTGKKTTYDAITGIDGYLESAGNLIHHTESIQRYRTLSKFIRENYGSQHGMENLDGLTDEQIEKRISDIQNNKLSKYVAWLDEQANALAGKKGAIDRSVERFFGRKVYSALNTLKSQVGSNMTGFNVRSAMTNFASAVQGASKTNKLAFLKGTLSTINNIVHDDGLIDKSNFLTNRFGSDTLSKKAWQKVANAGQIFMTGSDYFTANQIWRSKYYENLSKGMSENQAIKNADDFASRIMGDRSKGQTAEIFNSKTLGFLTQFQLEVNNQWNSILHDNKIDLKNKNKSGAMVTFQLGQLFAASYLFNNLMKSLTGSDVMFDPIDILKGIFKPDDKDKDKTLEERSRDALGKLVNQLPMASIFTGGRIPLSEAFKGVSTGFKYATNQNNEYGQKYSLEDVKDDVIGSAAYWLLPTGYGQIKKTVKGLSMFDDKLPVKGSYTKSGNLRFSVDDTASERVKASLFGQYATKHAQDYIDSEFESINKSKLDEMKDLKMNSTDYKKLKKGINESGTSSEDKLNYIKDLDISNKKKNILASGVMKKDIDMKEYSKYDSLNEYKYAKENPSKYQTIRAITTYNNYKQIQKDLSEIKADVDRNGKTISNSRFKKVVNYVNSLKLTAVQKAMLIKQEYPSFKQYDNKIAQYINKQNYDFRQKATILKGLGFSNYDKQIINYVKEHYQSTDEQVQVLKDMGFKTYEYNGKIYIKR